MTEFVDKVMARIKFADPRDEQDLRATAARLESEGFTVDKAVQYLRCTEEVNPGLPEDVALRRMAEIRASL